MSEVGIVRSMLRSLMILIGCGSAWGGCKPEDLAGSFAGTALSQQAGKLDVLLNLRCSNGKYKGELTTPVGNFSVASGTLDGGQLHLQLVPESAGSDAVIVEARLDGEKLHGSFVSGDDKGVIELRRTGDARSAAIPEPNSNLSPNQWHEDLSFLARELPKRHANAFHFTPREKFEAAVAVLDAKIDHLNPDEIYVGMDQLANLIGDGHTYIEFPPDKAHLPIGIRQFGDEYRVIAVCPGYEKALGARIVRIDNTPIMQAREIAATITPVDETPELKRIRIERFLTIGMALHGLGITTDRNVAHYRLMGDDGKEFTIDINALPRGTHTQWISVETTVPLYRQNPAQLNWCKYIADAKMVYCNLHQVRNLASPGKQMRELVDHEKPQKLVIDLRQNGGGDYNDGLKHFIRPIRDLPNLNRKGHLFVLVGPNTFSAAMSNAAQYREQTEVMLVGETIGEKPNSYQESRHMTLPHSRWEAHYSVRFYKFVQSSENIIRPDKEIIPTWEDFKAGRDPVLEWVLHN
jgi:hypothetical protein